MGHTVSKFCSKCFKSDEENPIYQEQEMKETLISELSSTKSSISLPNNISGTYELSETTSSSSENLNQEHILRLLIEKATQEFLDHLYAPLQEEGCQELVNKDGFLVYGKELPDAVLIKASWLTPYTVDQYKVVMEDINNRTTWDHSLEKVEFVSMVPPDIYITYSKFKKMPMISSRDMVLVSRLIKLQKGVLLVDTSCEHPDYPITDKFVRATLPVNGYYIEPIDRDDKGNINKVINITIVNFGGKLPKSLIKTKYGKHVPSLVKKMHEEIVKITENLLANNINHI